MEDACVGHAFCHLEHAFWEGGWKCSEGFAKGLPENSEECLVPFISPPVSMAQRGLAMQVVLGPLAKYSLLLKTCLIMTALVGMRLTSAFGSLMCIKRPVAGALPCNQSMSTACPCAYLRNCSGPAFD